MNINITMYELMCLEKRNKKMCSEMTGIVN